MKVKTACISYQEEKNLEDALLADICDISLMARQMQNDLTESIHLWKHQKNSFKI